MTAGGMVAGAETEAGLPPAPEVAAPAASAPAQASPGPSSDRRAAAAAVALLVLLPVAVFGGAALLGGHLLLTGDNLIQNYPLRVLAGSQLRAGHLPVWDPYLFGGTPLMAGLNAGAFFPTTLLFAVAPAHLAWALGEILLYSSVGVGTFLLLRAGGASVLPCLLGAASFAFAGAAVTQLSVHFDMGGGIACLPWALLAARRIVEDGRWRYAGLLAAALGLAVLAGSPEALLGTIAATATFGAMHWSLHRGSGWRLASRSVVAGAAAVGGTAFVWLPALRFIAVSQRASVSELAAAGYAFPPRSGVLALVPYLEGGYRLFSQGAYFGPSNSGEVTLYIGILPVVAVVALVSRRWARLLPHGERRCWYAVLVVAAVLAVAAGTPLEHLIYHVPFYGRQRDSGRSIVEVDLAACALFAWWADGGRDEGGTQHRPQWFAALLPLGLVLSVGTWFTVAPSTLWHALGARSAATRPPGVAAAIGVAVGVAALAAVVALLRPRLGRRAWSAAVSLTVVLDLALFSGGSAYLSAHPLAEPPDEGPVLALVTASLSPGGRYAFFDPSLFEPGPLALAGEPDTGVLDHLPSVQGYGSLVGKAYADATLATDRDYLSPAGIATGAFSDLGLQVVVTVPQSFLVPVAALTSRPSQVLVEPPATDPLLPGGTIEGPGLPTVPRTSEPRTALAAGEAAGWWFGTSAGVTAVRVAFPPAPEARLVRVGLVAGGAGAARWAAPTPVPAGAGELVVPFGGTPAEGVAVQLLTGSGLGPLGMSMSVGSRAYLVDGALAGAIVPGRWAEVGSAGGFAVFRAEGAAPRAAWLDGTPGSATVVGTTAASSTVAVDAGGPGLLVVGVAYDPGWHATVTGNPGDTTTGAPVVRDGLVESVAVPAGKSAVTLTYSPPGLRTGGVVSLVTVAVLAAGGAVGAALAARRRRRPAAP